MPTASGSPQKSDTSPERRCSVNLKLLLQSIEQEWIIEALRISENNIARAARFLHMNRTTLIEKMRRYGIRSTVVIEGDSTP